MVVSVAARSPPVCFSRSLRRVSAPPPPHPAIRSLARARVAGGDPPPGPRELARALVRRSRDVVSRIPTRPDLGVAHDRKTFVGPFSSFWDGSIDRSRFLKKTSSTATKWFGALRNMEQTMLKEDTVFLLFSTEKCDEFWYLWTPWTLFLLLKMFYHKRFFLPRSISEIGSASRVCFSNSLSSRGGSSQFCLWFPILIHVLNPWSAWSHTHRSLLASSLVCSLNQVPPLRGTLQAKMGRWPRFLAPHMPTSDVAPAWRQLLGPPYVLYTVVSHFKREPCPVVVTALSSVSVVSAISGGVLVRPDNDWARVARLVGHPNSASRKRTHGTLMMASFFLNAVVFVVLCWAR